MIQVTKNKNLLQKSGMLQKVKQQKIKKTKNSCIKFQTESIKSSLCDYSDAFILVTGDITVTGNNDAYVAFKKLCTIFYMQDRN